MNIPREQNFTAYQGMDFEMLAYTPDDFTAGTPCRAYIKRTRWSKDILGKLKAEVLTGKVAKAIDGTSKDCSVIKITFPRELSNQLTITEYDHSFQYDVFVGNDAAVYGVIDMMPAISNLDEETVVEVDKGNASVDIGTLDGLVHTNDKETSDTPTDETASTEMSDLDELLK